MVLNGVVKKGGTRMRKPTDSELKAYTSYNNDGYKPDNCANNGDGILYLILDSPYLPKPIPIELINTDDHAYFYRAVAPDGFIFLANDSSVILGMTLKELSVIILHGIAS